MLQAKTAGPASGRQRRQLRIKTNRSSYFSWRRASVLSAMVVLWVYCSRLTPSLNIHASYVSDHITALDIQGDSASYRLYILRVDLHEVSSELEILAFAPSELGNDAQLYSESLQDVGLRVWCSFTSAVSTPARSVLQGEFPRVLLFRCPVPNNSLLAIRVNGNLELHLHIETNGSITRIVVPTLLEPILEPPFVDDPTKLAICVAPISGVVDLFALLEWRLHHASLGFQTVYWYDRATPESSAIHAWVHSLNHNVGVCDYWRHAPSLLSDSSVGDSLQANGSYADQVPYYMDCLAQSRSRHRDTWLALTDLDEWFLAEPAKVDLHTRARPANSERPAYPVNRGLSSFLAKQNGTTASVCAQRLSVRRSLHEALASETTSESSQPPIVLQLASKHVPKTKRWNFKCLHKPDSVESVFVHWPETLRSASRDIDVGDSIRWLTGAEDDEVSLLHVRRSELDWPMYEEHFEPTDLQEAWQNELWQARNEIALEIG